MKVAWITGCFGFVGRHLARELVGRGFRVLGIDRPEREIPPGIPAEPLLLDLSDERAVLGALTRTRPASIYHLASQSSAARSFEQPRLTLRTNVETTLGLLEALRLAEIEEAPRLLSVGSCEEYGAPAAADDLPIHEGHPLRPASPYAVSKAAQTLLCQHYRRTYGLPVLCTRSFTHTGPEQEDRFVFSSFARQIADLERSGEAGVLRVGNLEVVRDVSDVRDVARAYADLLATDTPHDVVNVCSGRGVRIREGLDHLLGRAKVPIEVQTDPARLRPSDVPRFVGDPTRLRETIGWNPSTPFTRSLDDLLQWWREHEVFESP